MAIFRGFIRFYMELDVTHADLSVATSQLRHKRKSIRQGKSNNGF